MNRYKSTINRIEKLIPGEIPEGKAVLWFADSGEPKPEVQPNEKLMEIHFVKSDGNGRRKIGPDPDHVSARPGQEERRK